MPDKPETTTPKDEKHSINWGAIVLWPVVILILYALSVGPVLMMHEKGRAPQNSRFLANLYGPLIWAYMVTPLHKPLGMYFHLWAPKAFNKNGDWHSD